MTLSKKVRVASPPPLTSGIDFWAGRIGNALLVASIVFAAFVGYTFSAPTVYRSSAFLTVDFPAGKAPRLNDAALLERRARDEVLAGPLIARLRTEVGADKLRAEYELHTLDGRAFSVAFRDPDRYRAQRITSELATRTAEVLPKVALPQEAPGQAKEAARQKNLERLLNFLAEHPEISTGPAPASLAEGERPQTRASPSLPEGERPQLQPSVKALLNRDPALSTLLLERRHVEQRLSELAGPRGASLVENPYQDQDHIWINPPKLRRRLNEIDRLIEARRSAILRGAERQGQSQKASATPSASLAEGERPQTRPSASLAEGERPQTRPSAELVGEWQRLLDALKEAPAEGTTPPQPAAVKIARGASLPRWPIEPNRVLLLWLGALLGLLTGALVALRPRPRSQQRDTAERRGSLPSIAHSLPPLPLGRRTLDSPLPLALIRPREQVAVQSIPVRQGIELAARRSASWRQELGARDPAVAATVPAPARDTLFYGTADAGERSLAITLRLDEPGYENLPPEPARTLGVEATELADWKGHAKLDAAARGALAEELRALSDEGGLIIGVVGSPREAKSSVSAELVLALSALGDSRVLLLEGDLTHPGCAATMKVKMPRSFGFSRQLEARAQGRLRAWNVVRCLPNLDVLGEGIMRTPGLMVGQRFAESVAELKALYDFVVIDGPSLQDRADCRALDAMLDATIFVHSRRRAAELTRAATLFAKKRFSWTIACD